MSLALIPNFSATLHENELLKTASNCSTECSLKYDYKTSTTSLKGCIDQSGNNFIGIPAIKLSSQLLSETTNAFSTIFNDAEYWMSAVYITKPGDNLFAYTNTLNRSLASDTNLSSLVIVHHDKYSNNYLVVYVPITINSSSSSVDTRGQMLDKIIEAIYTSVDPDGSVVHPTCSIQQESVYAMCGTKQFKRWGMDPKYSQEQNIVNCNYAYSNSQGNNYTDSCPNLPATSTYYCTDEMAPTLSGQSLNINELIPNTSYYFFRAKTTSQKSLNVVIFSGQQPIYLPSNTKLPRMFNLTESIIPKTLRERDITTILKMFKSKSFPINYLTGTNDEIYIQCQPTNQEGELLEQGISKDPNNPSIPSLNIMGGDDPSTTITNLFQDNVFAASLAGVVIMIILLKGAEFLMKIGTKKFLNEI